MVELVEQDGMRVTRPLVRLLIRSGVPYQAFATALKHVFVEAARAELASRSMAQTDSAVTLLSGVHRRDVRNLSRPASSRKAQEEPPRSLPAEVIARWMGDPAFLDGSHSPRLLARSSEGAAGSFDALVEGVSRDVRPRAMLDELLRLGAVREEEGGIRLVAAGFAPREDFGQYTADSQDADAFVWAHRDMTVTFSAGNDGKDANGDGIVDDDSMGAPATAKNVISVGASENDRASDYPCDATKSAVCAAQGGQNHIFTWWENWPFEFAAEPLKSDPSAGNAEQMAAFSSRGPTDDGRIKPDVVAPGSWVLSGYSDLYQAGYDPAANPQNNAYQYDGWGYPRNDKLKYMGGTSMATPLVAGGAAVVRDYYQEREGHVASAALVKATLVNSAVDLLDENNDGVNDNALAIPNFWRIHSRSGRRREQ